MWFENSLRGRKQRALASGEKSVWSSIAMLCQEAVESEWIYYSFFLA